MFKYRYFEKFMVLSVFISGGSFLAVYLDIKSFVTDHFEQLIITNFIITIVVSFSGVFLLKKEFVKVNECFRKIDRKYLRAEISSAYHRYKDRDHLTNTEKKMLLELQDEIVRRGINSHTAYMIDEINNKPVKDS